MVGAIILQIVLILLNAIFAAAEIAVISCNGKKLEKMAEEGDIILLIGKGHWDYEEINGVKYPFDERVVVTELWEEIKNEK